MQDKKQGILVIIGGAEDKSNDCEILRRTSDLAGGKDGKIIILTVATDYPSQVGKEYKYLFNKMGVSNIDTLHIETREDSNNSQRQQRLLEQVAYFSLGGDQLKSPAS